MDSLSLDRGVGLNMPVLNEAGIIGGTLSEIFRELQGINFTLCIVDDGSTDGTLDVIEDFAARNKGIKLIKGKKKGYGCQRGAASRTALEWLLANTSHVVFVEIDADGAQAPNELLSGIKLIVDSKCDIAIASKYLTGSKIIGRSLFRNFVSRFASSLVRLLISPRIKDYSNSYRFYNRRAAELLLQFRPKYTTPSYLLEILAIWIANDYVIAEMPTTYLATDEANSKVTLIDILRGFFSALEISFRFHRGAFRKRQSEL